MQINSSGINAGVNSVTSKKEETPERIFYCKDGYKYQHIQGTDSVTNLFGISCGEVSVSGNIRPDVLKTNDEEKPFTLNNDMTFKIRYTDKDEKEQVYKIGVKKGYKWDGASIPKILQWIIGKNTNPAFAVASMLHDVMCENHAEIGNDRKLSSNVFKALLKQNGTSNFKANVMTWAVDLYQKLFVNWEQKA